MKRRELLGSVGAGAVSMLTTGVVSADRSRFYAEADGAIEHDPVFEKREWGYVRRDWDRPTGIDRPVVYTHDGYAGASFAADGPTHYVRTSDGTLIATSVGVHSSDPSPDLGGDYVHVQSSVRATACSGGSEADFGEVYAERSHGWDGHEIVEWLADRPWSLDRIGLWGVSYSGMTALRVASTRPPSLACVSANVIMGDVLRGRTFPGGVENLAFDDWLHALPTLWWDDDHPSREIRPEDDPCCAVHHGGRDPRAIIDMHPDWYRSRTENDGYRRINFVEMAREISVPTYVSQAWQDGQTGPRGGPAVYDALDPNPVRPGEFPDGDPPSPALRESPKLLRAMNGYHGTAWRALGRDRDGRRWFDYWLRGEETGIMREAPVRLDVGMGTERSHGALNLDGFPASGTDWTRFYLGPNHALSTRRPAAVGVDTYTSSVPDYWFLEDLSGDDVLSYWSDPVETPTVIVGTTTATLFMASSEEDTEIYVSLADLKSEGGRVTYLQRGMLRASNRALDEERTEYDDGEVVRPYHTMVDPTPIAPGGIYRYDIEVFPLGHVLYPGHRLLVAIHAPPLVEGPDGNRRWRYDPLENGAENALYYGSHCPSSVLVPLLEWDPKGGRGPGRRGTAPPEPACGEPEGYNCIAVELPAEDDIGER